MTSKSLELFDLGYQIGAAPLFNGLDHRFSSNKIISIVGANGVGKSTLLRMLGGICKPDAGRITWNGTDIYRYPMPYKSQLGYVGTEHFLYPYLTVAENLIWLSQLRRHSCDKLLSWSSVLAQTDLLGYQKVLFGKLSDGLKKRVALAASILHQPSLLILDEPCAQLDPQQRQYLWMQLRQLRQSDRLIIFSTHHTHEILTLCDEIYMLKHGKLSSYVVPENTKHKDAAAYELA